MSLQSQAKYDVTQAVNIYSDLTIMNNDATGNARDVDLKFIETRGDSILDCPRNYYLSVVRFNFDTPTLPAFIPQIDMTQSNLNQTVYKIGINYLGNTAVKNVIFTPEYTNLSPPLPPFTNETFTSQYYHCSTVQKFLNDINETLIDVIIESQGFGGMASLDEYGMYFKLNSEQLMTIAFKNTEAQKIIENDFKIIMNEPLYNLMSGFSTSKEIINGTSYRILKLGRTDLKPTQFVDETYASVDGFEIVSEIPVNPTWTPINSIVLTTTLLPIVPTNVSPEKIYNSESELNQDANNLKPVLTDFVVPVSQLNTYRNGVFYEPSSEYRFNDLTGTTPIKQINISVFWKDKYGSLHPLKLSSGMGGSIKLLFRRKDFNNIDLNI